MERDVAEDILLYLRTHPNAADTLDGILDWWLPRQPYQTDRQKVEQALEHLVAQGQIAKKILADGKVLYLRKGGHRLTTAH